MYKDAILYFGWKTSEVWRFSAKLENITLCLCPDRLDRFKVVHVDSQIRVSSNSFRWIWFNYQETLLEKLFLTGFLEFMNRQLSQQWIRLRLCSHLPEKPPWKSWNDVSNRALHVQICLHLPGHFDSQIKDSSNSFRRRHSSEGVDAKFSSTLPKDSAVKCTNVRYTMKTRMLYEIMRNMDGFMYYLVYLDKKKTKPVGLLISQSKMFWKT